jgi:transposase
MNTIKERTYTSREAAEAAGISYRQLDYWLRQGAVRPKTPAQPGSGYHRSFTSEEVTRLAEVAALYRSAQEILRDCANGLLWEAAGRKEPNVRIDSQLRG